MTNTNFEFTLTLLLIDKVKNFRTSYDLTKLLAWKFGIIHFVDLIEDLEGHGFIKINSSTAIHSYEATNEGKSFLEENKEKLRAVLLEKYPNERDFISSIVQGRI